MELQHTKQWNWKQFTICFLLSLGALAFSYPSSIIGTTLAQPGFLTYMHLLDAQGNVASNLDSLIGAMSGVFQAGGVFGIFIATWILEKYGRRAGMWFASLTGVIGGVLVCASQNVAMFIVFKFVAGMSSLAFLAISPVYCIELAPPALRGLFVGCVGINIAIGYGLATYMGLAFYHSSNPSTQWRGPYGISLIWSALPGIVAIFTPESPRWLLLQERVEDAKRVVRTLHLLSNNEEHHFAMVEFYQMQKQAEYDRTLNPSYWQMFKRKSYRNRVLITTAYAALGQSTAILVINNYGPTIFSALGYDTLKQLQLQCGWITCGIAGNLTGALVVDKFGRKAMMIFGIGGCLACLIVEAAVVATCASPLPPEPNYSALRAAVAAFYVFVYFYGCGVDIAGWVFFGEVYPNHLRAKGLALATASFALTSLAYLQASPTAFRTIGWKFYLVFICCCVVGLVFIIFAIPETNGVPLEEVAAIFGDEDEVVVFTADIQSGNYGEIVVKDHVVAGKEGDSEFGNKTEGSHHEIVDL
ncbi:hypothetical protein CLAIMM_11976 [Cladophialophora immunda]|nr:hypothetical protein CLAIMM_11976 [Cladophialophora immunda]